MNFHSTNPAARRIASLRGLSPFLGSADSRATTASSGDEKKLTVPRATIRALLALLSVLLLSGVASAREPDKKVVLVITADASDYILAAGGTIAAMLGEDAEGYLVRVTNDDKDSWDLTPEETARRTREESEQAAKILGFKEVESLGYRAGELGGVSPTELRDRILFYIRLYKPTVMFIPNPYAEYVEVLDRFYVGQAAEDARRAASLSNYQPPFAVVGLETHITPELYYYAQPFDPRRREPESTATFVPQPKVLDIASTFDKKLRAAQALKTINHSMAMRIKDRLESTGRSLPLLKEVDEESVNKLVEINIRKLAEIAAEDTEHSRAEEFHYAGVEYQIPAKYLQ
jgi:LmbE family N-acetylglucosaminyl deacetylase